MFSNKNYFRNIKISILLIFFCGHWPYLFCAEASDVYGESPNRELASYRYVEALKLFNSQPEKDLGDLNRIGFEGLTPLIVAIISGNSDLSFYDYLLKNGADPLHNCQGITAIECCIRSLNVVPLNAFYQAGITVSQPETTLGDLIESQSVSGYSLCREIFSITTGAEILLKMGASPNATVDGRPPLFLSIVRCNKAVFDLLLAHGADPFPIVISDAANERKKERFLHTPKEDQSIFSPFIQPLAAAKRKIFCPLNRNGELYFSLLSSDLMKEVSNSID